MLCAAAWSARAETWLPGAGGSWNSGPNWDTGLVPNAVGATAIFTSPTAARTLTNDGGTAGITVGNISFDIGAAFGNSLTTGLAGSKLILNNGGVGVTLLTTGGGSGNNTISVPTVLSDVVTAQVDQISSISLAGSLNLTATITGTGGFVKQGDGLATFGTGLKTYMGATVLSGGRMRMSLLASPTATSFFTINAGAQLTLIPGTAAGPQTFTFGSGPLNLNGAGATSGPFAGNPGAIRNDRGTGTNGVFSPVITNAIVLQSNSLVHVQALVGTGGNQTPDGFLTFSGVVSGPGSLALTAPNSDADQGTLFLTAANTYEGGTFINGGILNVNSDAALGLATGGVTIVNNARLRASGALSTTARILTLGVGGGRIDTNGNGITLGVGSTVTGTALTKIGLGKLTIAGTQTYGTLTTSEGRTDLASPLGTGSSTITANAETNISVGQTLAALNIGSGSVVTLGAPLPPAPEFVDAWENRRLAPEMGDQLVGSAGGQAVPEPCSTALLLGGAALLLGPRRRAVGG